MAESSVGAAIIADDDLVSLISAGRSNKRIWVAFSFQALRFVASVIPGVCQSYLLSPIKQSLCFQEIQTRARSDP